MRLPGLLALEKGIPFYLIFKEFQSIMFSDEYETLFAVLEDMFREQGTRPGASFVMTGSRVNAMKLIFAERKFFYRQVVHLPLAPVENREIIDHVVRGFLYGSGKSFDRDLAMGACELFKCNLWYINHLASICDLMSKGFINEAIMTEALKSMLSLHEPRFMNMVDDLTDHQISLLRAVLDGVVKFSASDVIEKYRLHAPQIRKRQVAAASSPTRRTPVARRSEGHVLHEQGHERIVHIWTGTHGRREGIMPPAGRLVLEADIFHTRPMLPFKRLYIFLPETRTRNTMTENIYREEFIIRPAEILMQSGHLTRRTCKQHLPALREPVSHILV